jgi:hypothetical protein
MGGGQEAGVAERSKATGERALVGISGGVAQRSVPI